MRYHKIYFYFHQACAIQTQYETYVTYSICIYCFHIFVFISYSRVLESKVQPKEHIIRHFLCLKFFLVK